MPRSDREKFDDRVAALLRRLGIAFDGLTEQRRRTLLAEARRRGLNAHETALLLAYDQVSALLDADAERGRVLVDRLVLVSREWCEDDLVDATVVRPLEQQARQLLRQVQD
jgi:hypothetical protein